MQKENVHQAMPHYLGRKIKGQQIDYYMMPLSSHNSFNLDNSNQLQCPIKSVPEEPDTATTNRSQETMIVNHLNWRSITALNRNALVNNVNVVRNKSAIKA